MNTDHKVPLYASLHQFPVTTSLLGQNIVVSTLFSNTLSLCSSLSASDQVSHPYKTRSKCTVLSFLIFIVLDRKMKRVGSTRTKFKDAIKL